MKQHATSKNLFDPAKVAAALAAAPDAIAPADDWDNAIKSHGGGVEASVTELREARRRGAQKSPVKVPTTIRLDADVLEALQASGMNRPGVWWRLQPLRRWSYEQVKQVFP